MILRLRGLRIDENVEIGLREKKERFFGRTVGTGRPGEGGTALCDEIGFYEIIS